MHFVLAIIIIITLAGFTSSSPAINHHGDSNCPFDWVHAQTEGCFKFLSSKTNITWLDAQYACEKEGGYLAEPKTLEQMLFLSGIATLEESFYGIKFWWIGLLDIGSEGVWFWGHSREQATEVFWGEGSPSNQPENSLDCAYIQLNEGSLDWKDDDCRINSVGIFSIAPICQREIISPEHTTTTSRPKTTLPASTTRLPATTTGWPETTTGLSATTWPASTTGWPATTTVSTTGLLSTTRPASTTGWPSATTVWPATGTTTEWPATETTTRLPSTASTTRWPATTTATVDGCPDASSEFEGRCFYPVEKAMSWLDAREKCHSMGADLASIHSSEQDNFIDGLIGSGVSYWLGATDSHSEGNWLWSNGSPWNYDNWSGYSGGVETNCLRKHLGRPIYWRDEKCFNMLPFICEFDYYN